MAIISLDQSINQKQNWSKNAMLLSALFNVFDSKSMSFKHYNRWTNDTLKKVYTEDQLMLYSETIQIELWRFKKKRNWSVAFNKAVYYSIKSFDSWYLLKSRVIRIEKFNTLWNMISILFVTLSQRNRTHTSFSVEDPNEYQ